MDTRAFEPEKLLTFPIPEIRERWSLADTVFYNLSIGIGADHLSPSELKYVREQPDVRTLPSMATVMAHPGFWLEHPQSGVDPRLALHGEQLVELDVALPAEADILSKSRVSALIDKGEGKDAVLETVTDLIDVKADRIVARLRRTTVLRKCGGFGGENPPALAVKKPEGPADITVERATLPQQALIYALNGDSNPLHVDPATATCAGFPGPLLHGLCTFGIVGFLLAETLYVGQPERMRSLGLRFSSPVYPGDTIVASVWKNGLFEASVAGRDQPVVRNGTSDKFSRWPKAS